jgi:CubicO group peptidase (beta-lactamase class C family)
MPCSRADIWCRARWSAATRCLVLLACLSLPSQAQRPAVEGDLETLRANLGRAVATAAADYWGVVLVAVDGKVVMQQGYGARDHGDGSGRAVANDENTLFDVGGLSRLWTVTAALRLEAARRLRRSDSLSRHIEDWPEDKAAILVDHLLTHRSALPKAADWQRGAASGPVGPALRAVAATQLVGQPGGGPQYSNLNELLLAMLVELRGGDAFEEVVRKRVFRPFGMKSAAFLGDRRLDGRRLAWRRQGEQAVVLPTEATWNWTARGRTGLLASADDVHAFLGNMLRGRLLTDEMLAALWRPAEGGDAYRVIRENLQGQELWRAHGSTTGFRSRLVVHPASRSWVVLLCDERELDALEAAIGLVLMAEIVRRDARAPVAGEKGPAAPTAVDVPAQSGFRPGKEDLARFSGVFRLATGGTYEIRERGGALDVTGCGPTAAEQLLYGGDAPKEHVRRLREIEDSGLLLLQQLVDGGSPEGAYAGESKSVAGQAALAAALAQTGASPHLRYLCSDANASRSWFRLSGRADVDLAVRWDRRLRIAELASNGGPLPTLQQARLVRRDYAVLTVASRAVTMTVEGQGASRVLVVEDERGIAEAEWIGR